MMALSFVSKLGIMLAPSPTALPSASALPRDVDQLCVAIQANDGKEEQTRAFETKNNEKDAKSRDEAIFQSDDYGATTIAGRPLKDGTTDFQGIYADAAAC